MSFLRITILITSAFLTLTSYAQFKTHDIDLNEMRKVSLGKGNPIIMDYAIKSAISANGKYLAILRPASIQVYHLGGQYTHSVSHIERDILPYRRYDGTIALSSEGRYVAYGDYEKVLIFDRKEKAFKKFDVKALGKLAFLKEDKYLLISGGQQNLILDFGEEKEVFHKSGYPSNISQDGDFFVTVNREDKKVIIYDIFQDSIVNEFDLPDFPDGLGTTTAVSFSTDKSNIILNTGIWKNEYNDQITLINAFNGDVLSTLRTPNTNKGPASGMSVFGNRLITFHHIKNFVGNFATVYKIEGRKLLLERVLNPGDNSNLVSAGFLAAGRVYTVSNGVRHDLHEFLRERPDSQEDIVHLGRLLEWKLP